MQTDILLQAILQDQVRMIAISGKEMVETARQTHKLSRVLTAALGRQMLITAMMAADLKQPSESLTTIIRGGGPSGNLVCTGRYGALVKGYAHNPAVELPPTKEGKLDVGGAVGRNGRLTIIRDLHLKEPYTGESDLVSGEIAEDFAQYFALSEQVRNIVYAGVRVDIETGEVRSAGGIILMALPACPEETLLLLNTRAQDIAKLSLRLDKGEELEQILHDLFGDLQLSVVNRLQPQFSCDCSRERTEKALIALGREELTDMIEKDGGAELSCQFCGKKYIFRADELKDLLQKAQS
jgi:molecular chaperone Hsp33